MKNSKRTFESAGQNTFEIKKSQKHDANLQKNSTLYFQIGLILCLLGTYALFEMQFQDIQISPDNVTVDEVAAIDVAPIYQVEVVKPQKDEPKAKRSTVLIDKYEEIKNDEVEKIEDEIFTPDAPEPTNDPVIPSSLPDEEDPDDEHLFVPFSIIEKVPVYPGCEKYHTNDERKKCMSKKIDKLVSKKFNTSITENYGISGKQKIQTQFTVDKEGNVINIKVRAPHPALEKEALRVINKIPQMEPGLQRMVPVGVIYTLPITFYAGN